MRNGKQLHITSEEATGDRLNDRIRSIEYVRAGERINAASARPRGSPSSCIYFRGGQSHPAEDEKKEVHGLFLRSCREGVLPRERSWRTSSRLLLLCCLSCHSVQGRKPVNNPLFCCLYCHEGIS